MKTLFLVLINVIVVGFSYSQEEDSTVNSDIKNPKLRNEIFKVNMFPMIGGRLSFSYEFQLNSSSDKSVIFDLNTIGTFPVYQYESNSPKGYGASIALRTYLEKDRHNPLEGLFYQISAGLGNCSHYELEEIVVSPTQKIPTKRRVNNQHAMFFFNVGNQFVLHSRFSLELMVGAGFYFNSLEYEEESTLTISPQKSPTVFGFYKYSNMPLVLNGGIKLGYIF